MVTLSFPLFVCVVLFSQRTPCLTESPQPYSWASVNCLPWRISIVLRTRTIKFKGDPFSRGIISYDSWGYVCTRGGSFHMFRLIRPSQSEYAISKRGPHYMG